MGSLVVKLDRPTIDRIKRKHNYSDIDMLGYRGVQLNSDGGQVLDVPMAYDIDAVKMAVRNILMWRVGESVISPNFGHRLNANMYSQMNTFNKDAVCEEIKRAIEENEPRVQITTVSVKRDEDADEESALNVRVAYRVVGINGQDSAEFTEQTTILGK